MVLPSLRTFATKVLKTKTIRYENIPVPTPALAAARYPARSFSDTKPWFALRTELAAERNLLPVETAPFSRCFEITHPLRGIPFLSTQLFQNKI